MRRRNTERHVEHVETPAKNANLDSSGQVVPGGFYYKGDLQVMCPHTAGGSPLTIRFCCLFYYLVPVFLELAHLLYVLWPP